MQKRKGNFKNMELRTLRHSASHVMAQAIQNLFPGVKFAIGPAIDSGFYYDMDLPHKLSNGDFEAIEAEMDKIIAQDLQFEKKVCSRAEALELMKDQPYKLELLAGLPENEEIYTYTQGDFTDLCSGPHLERTGLVGAFKLMSVAGAYWRGDEKNKMLQRIYGTAFETQAELDGYLNQLEEAKKRDHRRLGLDLGLFVLLDEGPGFPFFLPNGIIIRNELERFWREEHARRDYQEIRTPIMLNEDLWRQSGHWDHYKDNMYFSMIDEKPFALKPMNCPGSILLYKLRPRSYRELPIRLAELGLVHRHENSGNLHGLMRVRCFTQDDAHIFMTPTQTKEELVKVMDLVECLYAACGFKYNIELSTRPEDSMGTAEQWEIATNGLKEALEAKGLKYKINEGDGAFYGPKIDFHLQDSIGRAWQCGTIQLDFQMPERFGLEYVNNDGQKRVPIMIHRAGFGSIERFIGILTEHFAGDFPLWLAPVQVAVMPISEKQAQYAEKVASALKEANIRVGLDRSDEKLSKKLKCAITNKIPYSLILGEKEEASGVVAVRNKRTEGQVTLQLQEFVAGLQREISAKAQQTTIAN
ncbi:MAG: threonine--tRNA ligase [Oscillospiraceae bacterium]|jgi:threonyl-tRNA synthetase|nr:threonine--tRNA ligase [Oscillospiraceae bacterium]